LVRHNLGLFVLRYLCDISAVMVWGQLPSVGFGRFFSFFFIFSLPRVRFSFFIYSCLSTHLDQIILELPNNYTYKMFKDSFIICSVFKVAYFFVFLYINRFICFSDDRKNVVYSFIMHRVLAYVHCPLWIKGNLFTYLSDGRFLYCLKSWAN